MTEQIRGRTVVQTLTPGEHASTVAVVEGDAVIRVARPDDPTQSVWPGRAKALRAIEHPSLARPKGASGPDPAKGLPAFVAHEHVSGPTLTDLLQVPGVLTEVECATIVRGLAEGLRAMHEAGIAHGRVHAGQVRLRSDGTPVLLDVGATWGDAEPSPVDDIEALITLAEQLPETPRLSALMSLRGSSPSADDFLAVLDGAPSPADLVGAALDDDLVGGTLDDDVDVPVLTAPSVPTPEEDEYLPEPDPPSAPTPLDDDLSDVDDMFPPAGEDHIDDLAHPSAPTPADESPAFDGSSDPTAVNLDADTDATQPQHPTPFPPATPDQVTASADETDTDVDTLHAPSVPSAGAEGHDVVGAPGTADDYPTFIPAVKNIVSHDAAAQDDTGDGIPAPQAPHAQAIIERPTIDRTLVARPEPGETAQDVAAELARAIAARDALTRQVSESAQREQRLEADLAVARAQAQAATTRAQAAADEIAQAHARIAELEANLVEAQRAADAAQRASQDVSARLEQANGAQVHLAALEAAAAATDETLRRINAELAEARSRTAELEAEIEFLRERNNALGDQVSQDAERIVELEAQLTQVVQSADAAQEWESQRAALVERAEVAEAQVRALNEHIDSMRAQQAPPLDQPAVVTREEPEDVVELRAQLAEAQTKVAALERLTLDLSARQYGRRSQDADDTQVALLRSQVESLSSQLEAERLAFQEQISEITRQLDAARGGQQPTSDVLPVTPAPQAPTVVVVDPVTSPAGPGLVRLMDDLHSRDEAHPADPSTTEDV